MIEKLPKFVKLNVKPETHKKLKILAAAHKQKMYTYIDKLADFAYKKNEDFEQYFLESTK